MKKAFRQQKAGTIQLAPKRIYTPVGLCLKSHLTGYIIYNSFHVIWLPQAQDTAPHVLEHYVLDKPHFVRLLFPCVKGDTLEIFKVCVAKIPQHRL